MRCVGARTFLINCLVSSHLFISQTIIHICQDPDTLFNFSSVNKLHMTVQLAPLNCIRGDNELHRASSAPPPSPVRRGGLCSRRRAGQEVTWPEVYLR